MGANYPAEAAAGTLRADYAASIDENAVMVQMHQSPAARENQLISSLMKKFAHAHVRQNKVLTKGASAPFF